MCRPVSQDGLGIHHLQYTNMALLTKWVRQMMQPSGRLSIGGAKRRVQTFAGLGDVVDPEKRRFCIYGQRAGVFNVGAEVLLPATRGREDFPVLG